MSHTTRALLAFAAMAAILPMSSVEGAPPRLVRRCEFVVPARQRWTLARDVTCRWRCTADASVRCHRVGGDFKCPIEGAPACRPEQISIKHNAILDLNGFTLRGASPAASPVVCDGDQPGRCSVAGPGALDTRGGPAVSFDDDARNHQLSLVDVSIPRPGHETVIEGGGVTAVGVEFNGTGELVAHGIAATRVFVSATSALVSRALAPDREGGLSLRDVELRGSAWADGHVVARNVRDAGFGGAIGGNNVFLRRVQLGPGSAIRAEGRLQLRTSNVDEIESGQMPELIGSTCTRSRKLGTSETWGVCTQD